MSYLFFILLCQILLVLELVNLTVGIFLKGSLELPSPENISSLPSKSFADIENIFNEIENDKVVRVLQNDDIDFSQSSSNLLTPKISGVFRNTPCLSRTTLSNIISSNSIEVKTCDASTVFEIRSLADLNKVRDEDKLECLFSLGVSPKTIPVGMYDGHILRIFTTEALNQCLSKFWTGKIAFKTQCQSPSSTFYIALNLLNRNVEHSPLMYIGELAENLHPSEHNDGKKSLFIDYATNFGALCQRDTDQKVLEPSAQNFMDVGIPNPFFPLYHVIDMVRVVGKTPDGGYVMLGKTLAKNPIIPKGARTVAWWAAINYDYPAYPEIPDTFGPLSAPFGFAPYPLGGFVQDNLSYPIADQIQDPNELLQMVLDSVFRRSMSLDVNLLDVNLLE